MRSDGSSGLDEHAYSFNCELSNQVESIHISTPVRQIDVDRVEKTEALEEISGTTFGLMNDSRNGRLNVATDYSTDYSGLL